MRRPHAVRLLLAALLGVVLLPARTHAQAPLENFVRRVALLWEAKDVDALVDLIAETDHIVLDTGRGMESVNARHASAALRSLFSDRESVSVRPVRATLSGGQPQRGFGELSWSFRPRGAPSPQLRSVYVGAVWDGRNWRISELRLLP